VVPEAVIIAGANGAGKTTFARQFLPALHPGVQFLNVDEVQVEDRAFAHPVAAGRELLRRLAERERSRASFALETTLSSAMYARRILVWRSWGYRVSLHFIEVPSADFAVRRVAIRIAAGGHAVPEADVRRRFHRGLELLERVYKPIVDEWYHWYSDEGGLRLGEQQER
jgi:predicted ABC-type ATPase